MFYKAIKIINSILASPTIYGIASKNIMIIKSYQQKVAAHSILSTTRRV